MAKVMTLDDDHPGEFHFEQATMTVADSIGTISITVLRSLGARGRASVPYHSEDGTATNGVDFIPVNGHLIFDNDETE